MSPSTTTNFDAIRFVEEVALAQGLALTAKERDAVAVQLTRIQDFARLVLDVPLSAEDELAPRFEP